MEKVDPSNIGHISGAVYEATPRYFGTRLIARKSNNKSTIMYMKSKFRPITKIDLLLSNIYSNPLQYLDEAGFAPIGKCFMTYNTERDVLLIDDGRLESLEDHEKVIKVKDIKISCNDLKVESTRSLVEKFRIPDQVKSVIIKRRKDRDVIVEVKKSRKGKEPSETYNEVLADVIKKTNSSIVENCIISSVEKENIYLEIIDEIFLNYIEHSDYDLTLMRLGIPRDMKVKSESKLKYLNEEVAKVIRENKRLFDIYRMIILCFRKPYIKSNDFLTEDLKRKHKYIYDKITEVKGKNILKTSVPTFSSWFSSRSPSDK